MQTFVIPALQDYRVIVKGPIEAANRSLGDVGIHRPYRHVSWNNYGALHATVTAGEDQMRDWMSRGHWPAEAGDLCFFHLKGDE